MKRMIFYYFLILLTITVFLIKKDFFNPACITLFVWAIVEILYQNVNHGLNKLSPLFFKITFFYCLSFSLGSLLVSNSKFKVSSNLYEFPKIKINKLHLFLIVLLLLSTVLVVFGAIKQGISPIGYVRNIGLNSENVPANVKIINLITTLVYPLVFLYIESKTKKSKKILVFILFLLISVLSGSKSAVMQIFITSAFLLFYHKKFKILLSIFMVSFLVAAFVIITLLRDNGNSDIDFFELIYIYFFSPLPAFDLLINNKIHANEIPFAGTVLGLVYRAAAKFFGTSVPKSGLGFVLVPVPTNVYTIMVTGYLDFGRYGMFVFSFFYGLFWGWFYSFVKRNYMFHKLLYACFLNVLLLQFFADYLFPYLAIFIYQFLVADFIYQKPRIKDFKYLNFEVAKC